jgi:subfamily B ATP-binding cassette protein MsbA
MAIVLWFGGRLVISSQNSLQGAGFITFIAIFSQIINPAKSLTTSYYNIQKGMASAERILKILDAENNIVELPDAKPVNAFNSSIEYKSIVFAYQKEPVLKDVSVKIEKGQTIAIVGPSGAGKSTFVDLLPRFYDPTGGEILLDGVNTKNLKLHDLRQLMGIVTQEPILFNDTVFNNIAFGIPNATKEDVIAAAKVANAHDYVIKMEQGYDTIIGDRGSKLSGGERQRLTIARAVFKNPPILILDEATSSLDTESEKLVQDALYKLMKNRTSIVIAHRLSTIQNADLILVLQNGKIVERGNHQQLLAKNGLYTKLVELQQF